MFVRVSCNCWVGVWEGGAVSGVSSGGSFAATLLLPVTKSSRGMFRGNGFFSGSLLGCRGRCDLPERVCVFFCTGASGSTTLTNKQDLKLKQLQLQSGAVVTEAVKVAAELCCTRLKLFAVRGWRKCAVGAH